MNGSSGSVQSVARVLDITEALSTAPQGMSLSDLAATTGLHISTTHRLLGVLVERGYACKDQESGKYRLTLRLFEVGSRVSTALNLLTAAKPMLDELAADCQEGPFHPVAGKGAGKRQDALPGLLMVKMDDASRAGELQKRMVGIRGPFLLDGKQEQPGDIQKQQPEGMVDSVCHSSSSLLRPWKGR